MKNQKYKKRDLAYAMRIIREGRSEGLSILISTILVGLIVVFSVGVTTLVTEATRESANIKQGTTAYYAAESGLEQALWANQSLGSNAVGANEQIANQAVGTNTSTKFKIQGNTSNLVEKTVNGNYIIPFPWTGNVPWHGEGSVAQIGGCNPEKPPTRIGSTPTGKYFNYPGVSNPDNYEQEHPCNWNKLAVGEKATIPLYGSDGTTLQNFNDFEIRVRMPCTGAEEFCSPSKRIQLNCWDKGTNGSEKLCRTSGAVNNKFRGEVVLLWQINAQNSSSDSTSMTLNPYESPNSGKYDAWDSQLYEGKISNQQYPIGNFQVLDTLTTPFPPGPSGSYPVGLELTSGNPVEIQNFVSNHYKPALSLSVISSLVGCTGYPCTYANDTPSSASYSFHGIPYLEYQILLPNNAGTYPPAGLSNVITAEGQSGAFNQSIQVKVPNDNSTLEYVIQQ